MERAFPMLLMLLATSGGCQKSPPSSATAPAGPVEADAPRWPPPGDKAEPPPGVRTLMSRLLNAINGERYDEVKQLFVGRTAFVNISECDPPTVVDRVMEGRDQLVEELRRDRRKVTFRSFDEGYLLKIKRGEKPLECRARVDVQLYQARYTWEIGGKTEHGEAHFLGIGSAWFLAKL